MLEGILNFITNYLPGILIGLLILTFLVVAHEFGHFILARRNGVKVNEFGIGFPPRAIAWQKGKDGKWHKLPKSKWPKPNETTKSLIFSLNWLPIGGFCAMDGESDADTRKGTFGAASFKNKTKILFGGVMMNWIVAFIIFTILAFIGMPQFMDGQFNLEGETRSAAIITSIIQDSPAEKVGLATNDIVTKINNEEVHSAEDITTINNKYPGEKVRYEIIRNGETIILEPTLNGEGADYKVGLTALTNIEPEIIRSTWSAPIVGAVTTIQLTGETFKGLGTMIGNLFYGAFSQLNFDGSVREEGRKAVGTIGDQVTGPVGIIGIIFPMFANSGFAYTALLAAVISVSLACMNVLPIPALDGGRWLLIFIYKLRKKKLTKETEEKIVSRAFIVLIILMLVITALDITKFF
ncbi:site-2 protease family protein [Candidatus Saccharibacteria bacterium]|nr:site-2 protease family protein [Candidatus Saccharibacteria bacterium]